MALFMKLKTVNESDLRYAEQRKKSNRIQTYDLQVPYQTF